MRLKSGMIFLMLFCLAASQAFAAPLADQKADALLRQMSEAVKSMQAFSLNEYTLADRVMPDGQKIKLSQQAKIKVERPGRLRAEVKGDDVACTLILNGDKSLLYNARTNSYATLTLPPSLEKALEEGMSKLGLAGPLVDLLTPDPYATLTAKVLEGGYVGMSDVAGIPCHHLAFRQLNLDWEIWIDAGKTPLPLRLVITDKTQHGDPQQLLRYSGWKQESGFKDKDFSLSLPKDAVKFEITVTPAASGANQ